MNSFFISPVTHSENEDLFLSLKNGESTGPFSTPVKLLKLVKFDISRPLAWMNQLIWVFFLINSNMQISIHKKGAHTDPSNYQPIFLLSIFSKIFEKIMFRRLYEYLDNLNTFYHLQFGLREKHSTNHLMISITESIKKILLIMGIMVLVFSLTSKKHLTL